MEDCKNQAAVELGGGGELTIAAMDKYSRQCIGRHTYLFVRRCMKNPEFSEKIKARAAEIREEEVAASSTGLIKRSNNLKAKVFNQEGML